MDLERKRSIKVSILGEDGSPSAFLLRANDSVIPEGSVLREDGCICPVAPKAKRKFPKEPGCPYDPRFPNQNQTRHCYFSFVDFQRCARLLGDYPGCLIFYECYRNLCPDSWPEKWYDQMENGTFPRKIYPPSPVIRPDPDHMDSIPYEKENLC